MKKKKKMEKYCFIVLIVLFTGALVLFIYGLNWGLPDADHFHHSFHPDETASLQSSLHILLSDRPLHPLQIGFGNGAMQFYIVALLYQVIHGSNLKSIVSNLTVERINNLYLTGRILSVIMSVGAAILVFIITLRTFGKFSALIATLVFIAIPAVVVNAHYFKTDSPALVWILLSLLMSLSILKSNKFKYYILSAIFAGFATSTKYNSITIFFPLVIAHIINKSSDSNKNFSKYFDRNIIFAVLAGVGAFLMGSPGILIYWSDFQQALAKQWSYQTDGVLMEAMARGPGWTGYLLRILPYSLTWPLLIISLLGIIYAFWRRKKFDIMFLSGIIPYYLFVGSNKWWVVRYTLPLMPFFAILSARLFVDLYTKIKGIPKFIILGLGIIVIAFTLLFSLKLDQLMAAKDPRIMAYDWIEKNIPADKTIGIDFAPQAFFPCVNTQRYKTLYLHMNKNNLVHIDYYVANDQIYLHYLRLQKRFPAQANYFREIFYSTKFKKIAEFENKFNLLGIKFNKVDVPHDYLYFMPAITVYEKVEAKQ